MVVVSCHVVLVKEKNSTFSTWAKTDELQKFRKGKRAWLIHSYDLEF